MSTSAQILQSAAEPRQSTDQTAEVKPVSDLNFVDDSYFDSLFAEDDEENDAVLQTLPPPRAGESSDDEDKGEVLKLIFPVSDAKYAHGLQVQEALIGSISLYRGETLGAAGTGDEEVESPGKRMKVDEGESSLRFCEICAERKEPDQILAVAACTHASYCSDCISRHVETKIGQSVVTVTCPASGCGTVIELESCRDALPKGVIEQWEEALCRNLIGESERYYCPFKDCSAMLLVEEAGAELIRESECPYCHRLFCAQCGVPWHSGVDCEGFQRLGQDERGREDIMVMEMAKSNKWGRCPRCKFYVERTEGCPHIICRCKHEFCYGCGEQWSSNHGGCTRD
ncbi:unnamed protein product [Linum tenue]|uniref:RBR-type E3 ubiquitin transferase n=1 Tax=Linum tenue TaxID=586396 RepID=A0AAV0KFI5_9ROSI|nr:unnamed protein product [Linum tenue]